MKLKDQLILREVAGQYVIVPTGKRVQEVTSIVYISSSAAYLWDYMKDHEFEKEDRLVVQQTIEPTIITFDGKIIRTGTVILSAAPQNSAETTSENQNKEGK